MSDFDRLRQKVPRLGGCARCGKPKVGAVQLALRELTEDRSASGKSVTSRSRGYCEPCAVLVYEAALAAVVEAEGQPGEDT